MRCAQWWRAEDLQNTVHINSLVKEHFGFIYIISLNAGKL